MNSFIDLLQEYGANGFGTDGSISQPTNIYTQVAAQDNPDYASMLSVINKHNDLDRNIQNSKINLINSLINNKEAKEAADLKYQNELFKENYKNELKRQLEFDKLQKKKELGISTGGSGLTDEQFNAREALKQKNKLDYLKAVTDELFKRGQNKKDVTLETEEGKQGIKNTGVTYKTNEDIRKDNASTANKRIINGEKFLDNIALEDKKHENSLNLQDVKKQNALDILDAKYGYGLENLFNKNLLDKDLADYKSNINKELSTHRTDNSIKASNIKLDNALKLEQERATNQSNRLNSMFENNKKLQEMKNKAQEEKDKRSFDLQDKKSKANTELQLLRNQQQDKNNESKNNRIQSINNRNMNNTNTTEMSQENEQKPVNKINSSDMPPVKRGGFIEGLKNMFKKSENNINTFQSDEEEILAYELLLQELGLLNDDSDLG